MRKDLRKHEWDRGEHRFVPVRHRHVLRQQQLSLLLQRSEQVQRAGAIGDSGRPAATIDGGSTAGEALEHQRRKWRLALSQCLAGALPFHVVRRLDATAT